MSSLFSFDIHRKEFVDLYIDYIFNKSVEKQFNGFYTGFMKVTHRAAFILFKIQIFIFYFSISLGLWWDNHGTFPSSR